MKYIFLDFDGVLNSDYWFASKDYRRPTQGLTPAEVMFTHIHHHLSPKLIRKVNQLVKDSGAKVIASTSWRLKYSDDELNEFLRLRGADFKIEGRTPREYPRRFSQPVVRGDEINAFIKALPELPEGIVILDDIPNMDTLMPYLIRTDDRTGITYNDVKDALDIINKPFIMPTDNDQEDSEDRIWGFDDYIEGFDDEPTSDD